MLLSSEAMDGLVYSSQTAGKLIVRKGTLLTC
jgi:hypothetical protein